MVTLAAVTVSGVGAHIVIGTPDSTRERVAQLLKDARERTGPGTQVETFDLVDPQSRSTFDTALGSRPLFGEARILLATGLEQHTDPGRILDAAAGPDILILSGTGNTKPALTPSAHVAVEKVTVASAAAARRLLIDQWWRNSGHRLSDSWRTSLLLLAQTQPGTAQAVLATLDLLTETGHQVDDALAAPLMPHTDDVGDLPWTVWGHLVAGRLREATDAAKGAAPVAVWAYIGAQLANAGRVGAEPGCDTATAERLFALTARQSSEARKVAAMANGSWPKVWRHVTLSDVALKTSPLPQAALLSALTRLHTLLHSPAPQPQSGP